jgi:hypothetical protein
LRGLDIAARVLVVELFERLRETAHAAVEVI